MNILRGNPLKCVAAIIGMMAVIVFVVILGQPYSYAGSVIDPPRPAPNFSLTDQNGQPFQLDDLRGKIVLIYFGYTFCPDVCPTSLADLRYLERQLGNLASQVQVILITVDPERDTAEKLGEYLALFSPNFIGLTGSLEELEPVYRAYGVAREVEPVVQGEGYLINHSTRIYLIDAQGNLRLTFPFGLDRQSILRDVEHIVKE